MEQKGDSLGDRMKGYERAFRPSLPRRMPLIVRIDGKAFHTLTSQCDRPFDSRLMDTMNRTAIDVCREVQGAQLAFVQSDEISILVHNYKRLNSEAWFDNDLCKIVSISAACAAASFSSRWRAPAMFDARAFVLSEAEVCNYFIWRQQDAVRNSLQMAARAVFSHSELYQKNTSDMHEMLHSKGINWNDYPVACKRGRCVKKFEAFTQPGYEPTTYWDTEDPPTFTEDRAYIERHLAVEQE